MLSLIFTLISETQVENYENLKKICPACNGQVKNVAYSHKLDFYRDGYKLFSREYLHPPKDICKVETLNIINSQFYHATSFKPFIPKCLGGAIYTDKVSTINIDNSYFFNNGCHIGGAFAFVSCPNIFINGSSFVSNQATNYGGAGFVSYSNIVINQCHFEDNKAREFAALFVTEVSGRTVNPSQILNSEFIGNTATYSGSAVAIIYADFFGFSHVLFQENKANTNVVKDKTNKLAGALYIYGATNSRFNFEYLTLDGNLGNFDGFGITFDSTSNHSKAASNTIDYQIAFDSSVITQLEAEDNYGQVSNCLRYPPTVKFVNYSARVNLDSPVRVLPLNYSKPVLIDKVQSPTDNLVLFDPDLPRVAKVTADFAKILEEPAKLHFQAAKDSVIDHLKGKDTDVYVHVPEAEKSSFEARYNIVRPANPSAPTSKSFNDRNVKDTNLPELTTYRKEGFCTLTIMRSKFDNIAASGVTNGGVIALAFSTLHIEDSSFTGITLSGQDTKGGIIYLINSVFTLISSTFDRPNCDGDGSAIYLQSCVFHLDSSRFVAYDDQKVNSAVSVLYPLPFDDGTYSTISACTFVKGFNSIGISLMGDDRMYGYMNLAHSCFDSRPMSSAITSYEYLSNENNPDVEISSSTLFILSGEAGGETILGGTNKHDNAFKLIENAFIIGQANYSFQTNTYCKLEYIELPRENTYTVSAKDDKAIINNYHEVVQTKKETPWIFIIIGGTAFVIIVIIISIVIVRWRKSKREQEYDDEEEEEEAEMMAATTVTIGSVSELPVVSLNNPLCTVQQQSSDDSLFDDVDDLDFA